MSGTISFSLSQQFDAQGQPLAGGLFYTFVAGTTSTPQNSYQDGALTIAHPNPIVLDAAGRIPQFYLADGLIKIRLTDSNGVVQLVADNIQVIGPSSGGGGGGATIDPTTIYQTGDLKPRYGVGAHTGWVRANGLTIGSATSGGTERANADVQALFQYLWTNDTSLTVSGGRGASAVADWGANKTIVTPDFRGYDLSCLDDMGNVAAGRLGSFFANPTVLGSAGGSPSATLATGNLPPYTPGGSVSGTFSGTGTGTAGNGQASTANGPGPAVTLTVANGTVNGSRYDVSVTVSGSISGTVAGTAQGGTSTPFGIVSPRKLVTLYLKI